MISILYLSFSSFPYLFIYLFFNSVNHSCAFLQAMWQTMRLHHWHHSQKWRRPDRKWSAWTPAAQPSARMTAYPPPPQSTHTKQVRHINQILPKYFTTTKISNLRKLSTKSKRSKGVLSVDFHASLPWNKLSVLFWVTWFNPGAFYWKQVSLEKNLSMLKTIALPC